MTQHTRGWRMGTNCVYSPVQGYTGEVPTRPQFMPVSLRKTILSELASVYEAVTLAASPTPENQIRKRSETREKSNMLDRSSDEVRLSGTTPV